jgi:hypothetical protein
MDRGHVIEWRRTAVRWMYLTFLIPLCAPIPALAAEGHDYPGLGHIQGYQLSSYSERGFDKVTLEADQGQKIPVEGRVFRLEYYAEDRISHSSNREIILNFLAALKALKAEVLVSANTCDFPYSYALARFFRDGTPVYVNVSTADCANDGFNYKLVIVEQKEFHPSIVPSQ